jgi:hypothetical protein
MINLILATIAIVLCVAVAVYTLYAETEYPVDPRIADSYWFYTHM